MKKDLCYPDNHHGVMTYLKPEILKCLRKHHTNQAKVGDGTPAELFQILKEEAVKVLHSISSKCGKLGSGHRCGKGQFSFQSQRKVMPKNAQTTAQLHSSPTLAK